MANTTTQEQTTQQVATNSQDQGAGGTGADKYAGTKKATLENWQTELGKGDTKAQERQVQDNELVSKQLTDLTASNSKYIQQARDKAARTSAERGMLMSSIGAGAGERAAIDAALPIAQQDASTYTTAARDNQNAVNTDRLADQQMYGNLLGQAVGIDSNMKEADKNRSWQSGENALNRASSEKVAKMQISSQEAMQKANLEFQAQQNAQQQAWQTAEREAGNAWSSNENALNRAAEEARLIGQQNYDAWQQELNRQFQGDQKQIELQQQRFLQFDQSMQNYNNQLMTTLSSIYSNPSLKANEQAAAANNAKALHQSLYTSYANTMASGVPQVYWEPYAATGTATAQPAYTQATPATTTTSGGNLTTQKLNNRNGVLFQ